LFLVSDVRIIDTLVWAIDVDFSAATMNYRLPSYSGIWSSVQPEVADPSSSIVADLNNANSNSDHDQCAACGCLDQLFLF
jgi:hypothetical protein